MSKNNGNQPSTWLKLMQKLTASKSVFTRKQGSGNSEQSDTSNLPASHSGRLYLSIHDCPLGSFITCLCDRDLSALIIEGSVSQETLQATWDTIYQDYSDAISSESEQAAMGIVRKINLLEFRITKTVLIQKVLSERHDEELIELLRYIGAADSKYPDVPHLQATWFKRINSRVKRWIVEVEAEKKGLTLIQQSMAGAGQKVSRDVFQDFIFQIEKYVKFSINEKETTVGRFVAMVKDYQRYVVSLSKQIKK